jgi:hypothetical protein
MCASACASAGLFLLRHDRCLYDRVVVVVVVVFIYPDLFPGGYAGYHNYLYLYI